MKIRTKLLLIIGIPFFLIFATTVGLEYTTQREAAIINATASLVEIAERYASTVESKFVSVSRSADTLAISLPFFKNNMLDSYFDLAQANLYNTPSAWGVTFAFTPYSFNSNTLYFAPYFGRTKSGGFVKKYIEPEENYNYLNYDWFLIPEITRQSSWIEPYYDRGVGNLLVCSYSSPVINNGFFQGVVSINVSIDEITKSLRNLQNPDNEIMLVSGSGVYIHHRDPQVIMRQTILSYGKEYNIPSVREFAYQFRGNQQNGITRLEGAGDYPTKWIAYAKVPSTNWVLFAAQTEQSILKPVYKAVLTKAFILAFCQFTLFCLVYILLSHRLTHPLAKMAEASKKLAEGDLEVKVEVKNKNDEIFNLANAFNKMVEQLRKTIDSQIQETTARRMAEEANQAKSDFLANMSHEIRTPMNAIIGFAYLARQTNLTTQQKDYLDKIYNAGNSLLAIINEILDFSKIEAGKLEIETVPFNLHEVLNEIGQLFSSSYTSKGLTLDIDVNPNVPGNLLGDSLRISQVLRNLVSNAIKFTESGGIILHCGLVEESEEQLKLLFSIKDTGIGMSKEQMDNLFTAFTQADSSISRKFGGTGLGLTISKRLVELMGGEMQFASTLGEGSEVTFTCLLKKQIIPQLPLDQNTAWDTQVSRSAAGGGIAARNTPPSSQNEYAQAETAGTERSRYQGRVLLVEDNEINQQLANELLCAVGLNVDIAGDGKQAVERLLHTSQMGNPKYYQLILMDLQMPVMDGYEATKIIRARPDFNNIPIVAMTAHAMLEQKDYCTQIGMNGHISKPIDIDKLYGVLDNYLVRQNNVSTEAKRNQNMTATSDNEFLSRLDGFDTKNAIAAVAGKVSLYRMIMQKFSGMYSEGMSEKIENLIAVNDLETLRREAHTIKGLAGNLGHAGLQQAALNLENAAKKGLAPEEIKALSQSFLETLNRVTAAIQYALTGEGGGSGAGAGQPSELQELKPTLDKLRELLADDDIMAIEVFNREVMSSLAKINNEASSEIKRALANFDFESALNVIDRLYAS